jgi:hypothetical protein
MRMLRAFWDAAVSIDPRAEARDERHMPLCRAGELAALWKEGGLGDVEERAIEIVMRFGDFEDYWNPFLLKQGPAGSYAATLDRERLQALREQVKLRLRVRSESRGIDLPARVWAVRGTV